MCLRAWVGLSRFNVRFRRWLHFAVHFRCKEQNAYEIREWGKTKIIGIHAKERVPNDLKMKVYHDLVSLEFELLVKCYLRLASFLFAKGNWCTRDKSTRRSFTVVHVCMFLYEDTGYILAPARTPHPKESNIQFICSDHGCKDKYGQWNGLSTWEDIEDLEIKVDLLCLKRKRYRFWFAFGRNCIFPGLSA